MEYEPEIYRLIPFFYPSSLLTPPDPASTAARLAQDLQAKPLTAPALASELPVFLIHTATTNPAHTDYAISCTILLLNTPSLPLSNNWDSSHPNATFAEMFIVALAEDVDNAIRGPIDDSRGDTYVGASLLGARLRNLGILDTPQIVGSLAEGLAFPDEILYHYQGDNAEIALIGSCLQLLGGASSLVQQQPWRFTKDKILTALDGLKSSENDILLQFTKAHIQKVPLVDLNSDEIVDGLKAAGWQFRSEMPLELEW